jgi:hypothetical protein
MTGVSMAPPSADDIKKMMEDRRLVNIGENDWRLLSLGPTLERHHLVEVERNIWKQIYETDQNFVVWRATGHIKEIYPCVWRLVK